MSFTTLFETKARVLDLDEEVRCLKVQLAKREEIVGQDAKFGYFNFKSKPNQPLCPKCYQSIPSNTVFMGPLKGTEGYLSRGCPVCKFRRNKSGV